VGGVAAVAAVRSFPFRVFSFPAEPRLLAKETANYIITVLGSEQLDNGDLVWIMHPAQAKAWDRLRYKISAIDQQERTIELANLRQSQYNWKNLSRSPNPFRAGVT